MITNGLLVEPTVVLIFNISQMTLDDFASKLMVLYAQARTRINFILTVRLNSKAASIIVNKTY